MHIFLYKCWRRNLDRYMGRSPKTGIMMSPKNRIQQLDRFDSTIKGEKTLKTSFVPGSSAWWSLRSRSFQALQRYFLSLPFNKSQEARTGEAFHSLLSFHQMCAIKRCTFLLGHFSHPLGALFLMRIDNNGWVSDVRMPTFIEGRCADVGNTTEY